MRKLQLILLLTLTMLSGAQAATPFDATGGLPVSYQGRFHALEPVAGLWLYDTYHRTSLKQDALKAFDTTSTSPLELLWRMHFFGHHHWDGAPFFWIHYASLKNLLNLPQAQERFSYKEIAQQLYHERDANLKALRPLLAYEFAKAYASPAGRSKGTKIELTSLASGLWVALRHGSLTVAAAPTSSPWHLLAEGTVIDDNFDPQRTLAQHKRISEELLQLFQLMQLYQSYRGADHVNAEYAEAFKRLERQGAAPADIARLLETRFPLAARLQQAGTTLKMLPGRLMAGEWLSLHALKIKVYNPHTQSLVPINNFTTFPDPLFDSLRHAYSEIEAAAHSAYAPDTPSNPAVEAHLKEAAAHFASIMQAGYDGLAGQPYKKSVGKALTYPSWLQLKAESAYHRLPLIGLAIAGYGIGLLVLLAYAFLNHHPLKAWALAAFAVAFAFHTAALALRIYILERPPVSNMFETVLYVPWIAMVVGFIFYGRSRHPLPLAAAGMASLILLVLLKLTNVDSRLENVQAVLDSQFWLSIHVLMVVGCYGIFAVSGILGHFYLVTNIRLGPQDATAQLIARSILHTMYMGVALLIPGTILGGVWAAESWGRFWDWDPKESWAFISACVYVLVIHAYTFRYIRDFGLAVGAIAGLLAISFTWYGVNYILGTGLHSYGFGKGGDGYYFAYLAAELLFLVSTCVLSRAFGQLEKGTKN